MTARKGSIKAGREEVKKRRHFELDKKGRRSSVGSILEGMGPDWVVDEGQVHGPVQGKDLRLLRCLMPELLVNLERTMLHSNQPATRVAECYAAALSSTAAMAVAALVNVDVIDRVLTLCEVLQGKAGEQGSLESFAMRIHGYLFSTLLAITSHHHPSLQASSFGDWRGVRLSKSQLERVIQQMPLSQSATKLGAVVLWLQACIGSSDLIEELGGALVLCKMLTSAVIENSLQGTYLQQATWVCAALWRLSFHPENAATCLEHATPALLVAMQQTEYAPLSAAALGCVNVVLSGQIEQIGAKFEEYGFADALHMLSGNGGFRESDRITAARTLNNVDEQQREGADEEEDGAAAGRRQRRRRRIGAIKPLVRLSPLPMISRRRSTA